MAGSASLVVLGYPARRDGRAHPVQRWRVRRAMEVVARRRPVSVVFTGGARTGGASEASTMADLAIAAGLDPRVVVLEERATTTWENVEFARDLTLDADLVVLVSDRRHARRARRYWLRAHPEDRGRVVADNGEPGLDGWWLRPVFWADAVAKGVLDRTWPSLGRSRRP